MIRILTVLQVLLRMHEPGQHVASHHHLTVKKAIHLKFNSLSVQTFIFIITFEKKK